MNLLHFVNEIVLAAVEGFILLMLFTFFIERKDFAFSHKAKSGCFIAFYTVFSYWATLYTPPGIHTLIIVVFLIASQGYLTRSNIYASIVSAALCLIFMVLTEALTVMPLLLVLKADITILDIPEIKLLGIIIARALQLLLLFSLYRTRFRIFRFAIFKKENAIIAFGLFQTSMLLIIMTSVVYVTTHNVNIKIYQVLIICVLILIVAINSFDYRERERILRQKYKLDLQEEYVINLEASINMIRRERHDYANHLNTLLAMCSMKKADTLDTMKEYIERLSCNMKSNYQTFNSGNEYIDGLLAVKSNNAYEKGINLDTNFIASLSILSFSSIDLVSMTGNLIDNAMEALLTEPHKNGKYIFISSRIQNNNLILSIANNGPEISGKVLDRIFENGFTTKREKDDHGFGLFIVKQLAEKNKATIHVSSSEEETEFKLQFFIGQESQSHIA
jgi:two-component system, LytTR family, sensor histidine kinase AgrC